MLADAAFGVGTHAVRWEVRDAAGAQVPAGIAFVRLETAEGRRTRRLLVASGEAAGGVAWSR